MAGVEVQFLSPPFRGKSQPVTYNAADFFGTGGMGWTVDAGDVATYRASLVGKFLSIWIKLNNTTVVAPVVGNNLQMKLPNGALALAGYTFTALAAPGGAALESVAVASTAGSNVLTILRYSANWIAGVDNTSFAFNGTLEIQ